MMSWLDEETGILPKAKHTEAPEAPPIMARNHRQEKSKIEGHISPWDQSAPALHLQHELIYA